MVRINNLTIKVMKPPYGGLHSLNFFESAWDKHEFAVLTVRWRPVGKVDQKLGQSSGPINRTRIEYQKKVFFKAQEIFTFFGFFLLTKRVPH